MTLKPNVILGTVLAGSVALTGSATWASSHREAPAIAGMPRIDPTDFYMFRSYQPGRQDYTTLIANYNPDQSPYGGPNYFVLDNDAIYELHVDNNGDAVEDVTFRFNFDSELAKNTAGVKGQGIDLKIGNAMVAIPLRQGGQLGTQPRDGNINEVETYSISVIRGDRRTGTVTPLNRQGNPTQKTFVKPIDNIGNKTIPNYAQYAGNHIFDVQIPDCGQGRVFVGQRAEAFAVNLGEIFDLVNLVPLQGAANAKYPQYNVAAPTPGGIMQDRANDDLVGEANVTSIAMEIPTKCLVGKGNGVIGGWTTTSLPQAQLRDPSPTFNGTTKQGGAYVQVARLSAPLVNELVIGLKDKDLFNAAEPTQDGALATYVTNPTLPALLDILFRGAVGSKKNIAPSNFPRNDLVTAFLTGFPGVNQQAKVTASEMLRLNTKLPITPRADQNTFGLVSGDLAGFPNGRRPGDDTVDIALRVVMGALCKDLPLGLELKTGKSFQSGKGDSINLKLCGKTAQASRDAAPVGSAPFTDGAPLRATELLNAFPYLNTPIPGSPNN